MRWVCGINEHPFHSSDDLPTLSAENTPLFDHCLVRVIRHVRRTVASRLKECLEIATEREHMNGFRARFVGEGAIQHHDL